MNAVRSARSRRTSVWLGTLTGVLVLAAAPVVATAVGVGPAGAVARSSGTQRVFVSPQGHAGAAGTRHDPLASVDEAVARLTHGGVVLLRGGTYSQRVMLRGVHQVTIRPFGHEHVILDGGPLTPPPDRSAMVTIVNSSRVTVSGLDIRNYDTTSKSAMPIGIYVHGASSHVTLRRNHVHSMGNYNGTLGSFDINAHGIAVYGDRRATPDRRRHDQPQRGRPPGARVRASPSSSTATSTTGGSPTTGSTTTTTSASTPSASSRP